MEGSYNEKVDLWSAGVCLYFMLSKGKLPFKTMKEKLEPQSVIDTLRDEYEGCKQVLDLLSSLWTVDPD